MTNSSPINAAAQSTLDRLNTPSRLTGGTGSTRPPA